MIRFWQVRFKHLKFCFYLILTVLADSNGNIMTSKTWEEIRSFDEIIEPEKRKMITDLEAESDQRCPFLKKDGKFFYYCGRDMTSKPSKKLGPFNPIYTRHVDVVTLGMHCMINFDACCVYKGTIKKVDF